MLRHHGLRWRGRTMQVTNIIIVIIIIAISLVFEVIGSF
jgi:hypothetical protein